MPFLLLLLFSLAASGAPPANGSVAANASPVTHTAEAAAQGPTDDVIARVGDQTISYRQLSTMLNSSAVVGVSVPALGTPERVRALVILLDKQISANLLYEDALRQGIDRDPDYQADLRAFSDGLLAGLYQKQLMAEVDVSEDEVEAYIKQSLRPDAEVTEDMRAAIRASLRKHKYTEHRDQLRDRLREGVTISVSVEKLDPDDDALRDDGDVLATIDDKAVTWGEAKPALTAASERSSMSRGHLQPVPERVAALNRLIDNRIMAEKALAAGLEKDAGYQARYREYRKSHLINHHRHRLLQTMEPTDKEIAGYYADHQQAIVVPEQRKIQMVVLKTRDEADAVKRRIEAGELTIYQAAQQFSIDPNARQTLGEMGWVTRGTGFPELDKLTFSLAPEQIGGPVESPAGWHLVKVLDVLEGSNQDVQDEKTRKQVRRTIMRNRLNAYTRKLRKTSYEVVVFEDRLNALARQEAAWIAALEKKAQQASSLSSKREEEYRRLMQQP